MKLVARVVVADGVRQRTRARLHIQVDLEQRLRRERVVGGGRSKSAVLASRKRSVLRMRPVAFRRRASGFVEIESSPE
jgi:hypothetical protein